MSRVVAWSLLLLVALPASAGCTLLGGPDRWDLRMGIGILTTTGAGYDLEDAADAASLAVRQIELASYGIRYTVYQESVASGATAAFDRLVNKGAVVVVAAVSPDEAQQLASRAEQQKRVLLLATPANRTLAGALTYTLQVAIEPAVEGRALAALAKEQGATSAVVVASDDPSMRIIASSFASSFNGTVTSLTHRIGSQSESLAAGRRACEAPADAIVVLGLADEAGWTLRGAYEAGCATSRRILAGSAARQQALVVEAGEDLQEKPVAAGVLGVEPTGSRLAAFRSLFETEAGRTPVPGAAEAYDAVVYATLAAFAKHGSRDSDPVRAEVRAADLQSGLLRVAEEPGTEHREIARAIAMAKAGDDLDWAGYAHAFSFSNAKQPVADSYQVWRVTATGGVESTQTRLAVPPS